MDHRVNACHCPGMKPALLCLCPFLVSLACVGSAVSEARSAADEAREDICAKAASLPGAEKAQDLCRRGAKLSECAAALEEALAE